MSPFCRSADSTWSSKSMGRQIAGVRGNYQNAFGESCRSEPCRGSGLLRDSTPVSDMATFNDTAGSLMADNDGSYTTDSRPAFHNSSHQGHVRNRDGQRYRQSRRRSFRSTHSNDSRTEES
jgi:hypothetical protein